MFCDSHVRNCSTELQHKLGANSIDVHAMLNYVRIFYYSVPPETGIIMMIVIESL